MKQIVYLLIPVVTVVAVLLLLCFVRKQSEATCSSYITGSHEFRVSKRMLYAIGFIGVFFACFSVAAFVFSPTAKLFLIFLGMFFTALCIVETWRMQRALVVISNDKLTYYRGVGSKVTVVDRRLIKSVIIANGLIVIDAGEIPRVTIPVYFHPPQQIVGLLRAKP